jgi:MinD superfamily P-loop ATPase
MSATKTSSPASSPTVEQTIQKRIILTMGGKGGVGKTGVTLTIAEWLGSHEVPFTLLDLDTENKARGSLKHYYGQARKVKDQKMLTKAHTVEFRSAASTTRHSSEVP